jgi:hypothetical protein
MYSAYSFGIWMGFFVSLHIEGVPSKFPYFDLQRRWSWDVTFVKHQMHEFEPYLSDSHFLPVHAVLQAPRCPITSCIRTAIFSITSGNVSWEMSWISRRMLSFSWSSDRGLWFPLILSLGIPTDYTFFENFCGKGLFMYIGGPTVELADTPSRIER